MNTDYYVNIFTCTFSSRSVGSPFRWINLAGLSSGRKMFVGKATRSTGTQIRQETISVI